MSIRQLAIYAHTNHGSVSKFERCKGDISASALFQILRCLGFQVVIVSNGKRLNILNEADIAIYLGIPRDDDADPPLDDS